jgi:hypothetical protein
LAVFTNLRITGNSSAQLDIPPPQAHFSLMVAATDQPQLKPRKNAQGHSKRGTYWQITPSIEAQARTMYLVRDMPPAAIASALEIKVEAVYFLANHRGWAKMRRQTWGKADAEVQTRMANDVSRVMSGIALESEELTVGSLQLARESIAAKDAKGLSMSSTAIRNLVEVSRRIRGLDVQQAQGSGGSVNFFVLGALPQRAEASQGDMKRVEPAEHQVGTLPSVYHPQVVDSIETQKATIDIPSSCAVENSKLEAPGKSQ